MQNDLPDNTETHLDSLRAHTFNEVRYYLMVTPCRQCSRGPWLLDEDRSAAPPAADDKPVAVNVVARCKHCDRVGDFAFRIEHPTAESGPLSLTINPAEHPSHIVDLGQWLSLFYLLLESASTERSPSSARRLGYQASLCLNEALKFYADNEVPPESAFFVNPKAFREHPESFARQRLCDMQAKLPALGAMARRIERDELTSATRWWQFWRRGR